MFVVVAFTAWQVWQVQRDLDRARASVSQLRTALDARDDAARDEAIADLKDAAASASDRTSGPWWSALTLTPMLGDDADGIRVLSESLALVADDGLEPLASSLDDLDEVSVDGRIDIDLVRGLQEPVGQARDAFDEAAGSVGEVDSSGFIGGFRSRFDDYAELLDDASGALASAETAAEVLPGMVGADGPRDYLLIFQNNAEIRATGGLPGSWAQVHAEDGRLEMVKQGGASDFPVADTPVLPLTPEEIAVYGKEYGLYFQDPGFAPDFPRAADLFNAHWQGTFPEVELDGVLALDPVGMSYLLEGTGPVQVDSRTFTSENVVAELLNTPYIELGSVEQNALFQDTARAIFDAATGDLRSPIDFVQGLSRASREGRFLVGPFDDEDARILKGSRVLGALSGDDGRTPHVDIGLNDATGSKMSYYLRYRADVEAADCVDGRQRLSASMNLSQAIAPSEAAKLPPSVTGGGQFGTEPGAQLVPVRIYGPYGGTIDNIRLDGKEFVAEKDEFIDGRPILTVIVLLATRDDVVLNWSMSTGEGQTGDGEVGLTPSIVAGNNDASFRNAC